MVHMPVELSTVPTWEDPAKRLILRLAAVTVPVKVGVVSLVMLSPAVPVSLPAARTGTDGAVGAAASTLPAIGKSAATSAPVLTRTARRARK
jgi:hypothetical protein